MRLADLDRGLLLGRGRRRRCWCPSRVRHGGSLPVCICVCVQMQGEGGQLVGYALHKVRSKAGEPPVPLLGIRLKPGTTSMRSGGAWALWPNRIEALPHPRARSRGKGGRNGQGRARANSRRIGSNPASLEPKSRILTLDSRGPCKSRLNAPIRPQPRPQPAPHHFEPRRAPGRCRRPQLPVFPPQPTAYNRPRVHDRDRWGVIGCPKLINRHHF